MDGTNFGEKLADYVKNLRIMQKRLQIEIVLVK